MSSGTKRWIPSGSLLSHVKWEHMVAGVSGGVISTVVLHPLDLVKVRFQVNEGHQTLALKRPEYRGIFDAFRTIGRTNGIRGLYQGAVPNVWGAGASWGLYFLFYNSIKLWMQGGDTQVSLGPSRHMLAATQSGILTLALTNPIWVVKTRICLQYETTNAPGASRYKGMVDALAKIYQVEGVRGLYRGFVPGLFGVSHGALQFMAYEELKTVYNNYRAVPIDAKLSTSEYILFAALSKIFAATATYPYQVVRSRLQDQHRSYDGAIDVIRKTWRYERFVGFYKGISPYLVHVVPNICIVLVLYEHIMNSLATVHKTRTNSQTAPPKLTQRSPTLRENTNDTLQTDTEDMFFSEE